VSSSSVLRLMRVLFIISEEEEGEGEGEEEAMKEMSSYVG
jgi:hypothetical protein